jgi:hypothetical protein
LLRDLDPAIATISPGWIFDIEARGKWADLRHTKGYLAGL